ncbi:hypothetical protein MGYG_02276 [Nannizzia gypsea CBS 118893]|uniref:Uncharacterized protein n=1 Tax=Arthroderma gypseum (strain ATCC MYA-4604 / CBS 118893) TaxID=535722 RepID=E4UQN4_ARTGP|nr:hypothetical protein MGYG_02276 [Nannizzia gypsea CBS 118893]EFQ99263.1 hypothetical protein MGYG_02276 [Nannizzia gypsea CBS 118893]
MPLHEDAEMTKGKTGLGIRRQRGARPSTTKATPPIEVQEHQRNQDDPRRALYPSADVIQHSLDRRLIPPVNRDAGTSTTPGFLPLDSGGRPAQTW